MLNELTQKTNNAVNAPQKGLREPDLEGATGIQEINCPACKKKVSFDASNFVWETDQEFEFCDVTCPECKAVVELNGLAGMFKYDFFMS